MTEQSTEVATVDAAKLAAMAGSLGSKPTSTPTFMPTLKVNYDDEDEQDRKLTKGFYMVQHDDGNVYAETVVFRPMANMYSYQTYDEQDQVVTCDSLMISDFRAQKCLDTNGTERCGRPPSKETRDNPALAKLHADTKCYRNMYGTVTIEGKDADGKEVTLTDYPVAMRLKGESFMPFDEEYAKLLPRNANLWDYNATLNTTKHKSGKVSYWQVHWDANLNARLPVSTDDFETLETISGIIEDHNYNVMGKYEAAVKAKVNDVADAKLVNAVANTPTTDDDIPF